MLQRLGRNNCMYISWHLRKIQKQYKIAWHYNDTKNHMIRLPVGEIKGIFFLKTFLTTLNKGKHKLMLILEKQANFNGHFSKL